MVRLRLLVVGMTLVAVSAASAATSQPLPGYAQGRCPDRTPQALPDDAIAGATRAALAQAPVVYRRTKLARMRATKADLAVVDADRGGYARAKCGRRVQQRTVVVYLQFPAMLPSASLSEGVVLVGRFGGAYRVWAQLH